MPSSSSSSSPVFPHGGSPSARPVHAADLDLRDVVLIFRRRKGIVLAAVAAGVAIALLSLILAPRRYSATATVEINKSSGNSLGLRDLSGIAGALGEGEALNSDLLTEQAVILNDNTALHVIAALKIDAQPPYALPSSKAAKDRVGRAEAGLPLERAPHRRDRALTAFRSGLRVNLIKGTRLFDITFTDTDPSRAAAVANAVVDAYIDESAQAHYHASSKISGWLAGQLAELKDKVESSQAKADAFQRNSGLTGMTVPSSDPERQDGPALFSSSRDNVPFARLIELNRDLTSAEVARIAKQAIYTIAESQDPEVVLGIGSSALADGVGQDSPVAPGSADLALLQQLRQQSDQLQVQISAAGTRYGAKNPAMIQMQNEAATLDAEIRTELARIRARAGADLRLAVLAENGIRDRVAAQERLVNQVTAKADQLALLQEEALSSRSLYQDLYTKLEEASVTAGMTASHITIVNPAREPAESAYPNNKLTLGMGALIGLLLGFGAAVTWDFFDDSITVPEDVEELTPVPVLWMIPDFRQRQSRLARYGIGARIDETPDSEEKPWLVRAPRSNVAEAYRSLRTALLMSRAAEPPRVILITSALQGEGKSTTCLNTAAAFALQGDRVLYLDADLRRSQTPRFFEESINDVGLSHCLTSDIDSREAVRRHREIEGLSLLSAGTSPPNPAELLGSKRFADLIVQLRSRFDFVFIDSPPALLVTDAQLMSPLTDGFVLVLRAANTSRRALQRVLALMQGSKTPPLGIVLNAFDARAGAYAGYGYYEKGSRYYADATR
ncbi:MAG: polysaccharide biosynthesis tyrosine autokinase [Terracidiphilus sp.]